MTRYRLIALMASLAIGSLVVSGCGSPSGTSGSASITIKVADAVAPDADVNSVALTKYFGPALEKASNGKLKIRVFPAGQLGDESTLMKKLPSGAVDMVVTGVTNEPGLDALYTPWFFKDSEQIKNALDQGVLDSQLTELKKRNSIYVGTIYRSPREITANKPIQTPADLRGVKLRAPQFPGVVTVFKSLGANVAALPFPEVFTALQSGTVDAEENPVDLISSSKFYEVQKYLSLTDHSYAPYLSFVSQDMWSKLSNEQQQQFKTALKQSADQYEQYEKDATDKTVKDLESKGMSIVKPNRDAFDAEAHPVAKQFLTSVWGADTEAKVEALP
jgi:tripartite ATP-independent transporter DctP family solute receptor